MKPITKTLLYSATAALLIYVFSIVSSRIQREERRLGFSDFVAQLEGGHVSEVTITGTGAANQIVGRLDDGEFFRTFAPSQMEGLVHLMLEQGVEVEVRGDKPASWLDRLLTWGPVAILTAIVLLTGGARITRTSPSGTELETKARIHRALSEGGEGLSEVELASKLPRVRDEVALLRALYEMLAEGTILFTDQRKYRVKTVE